MDYGVHLHDDKRASSDLYVPNEGMGYAQELRYAVLLQFMTIASRNWSREDMG